MNADTPGKECDSYVFYRQNAAIGVFFFMGQGDFDIMTTYSHISLTALNMPTEQGCRAGMCPNA